MGQEEGGEEMETEEKPTVGWVNDRDTPVKELLAGV